MGLLSWLVYFGVDVEVLLALLMFHIPIPIIVAVPV